MSVFDLSCPDCGTRLQPVEGWLWRCASCGTVFEVCGGFVVEAGPHATADGIGRAPRPPSRGAVA